MPDKYLGPTLPCLDLALMSGRRQEMSKKMDADRPLSLEPGFKKREWPTWTRCPEVQTTTRIATSALTLTPTRARAPTENKAGVADQAAKLECEAIMLDKTASPCLDLPEALHRML